MALVYVGGQVGQFAGTTSAQTITFALTNGTDTAPLAGDLVVIAYGVASANTRDPALAIRNTAAVDYTLVGSELFSDDARYANLRVAYRVMPATPETQFVLTETVNGGTGNAADAGAYTVHVFRNHAAAVIDVATTTDTGIDTRLANPPAITPITSGAWIYVVGVGACGTGGTYTAAYLTDLRVTTQADSNDVNIGSGYVVWTSGAYDPAAFGGGGTDSLNDAWAAITVAIRPAGDAAALKRFLTLLGVGT